MYQVASQIKLNLDDCPLPTSGISLQDLDVLEIMFKLQRELVGIATSRRYRQAKEYRIPMLRTAIIQGYRTHELELVEAC